MYTSDPLYGRASGMFYENVNIVWTCAFLYFFTVTRNPRVFALWAAFRFESFDSGRQNERNETADSTKYSSGRIV